MIVPGRDHAAVKDRIPGFPMAASKGGLVPGRLAAAPYRRAVGKSHAAGMIFIPTNPDLSMCSMRQKAAVPVARLPSAAPAKPVDTG